MSTLEDQLTDRLHARVANVQLPITAEDVRMGRSLAELGVEGRRRGPRSWWVGAAALVVVAGLAAIVASSTLDDGTDDVSTAASDTTGGGASAGSGEVIERGIEVVADAVPSLLAPAATVLEADGVGRIEIGPPSAALLADHPELDEADCVATGGAYSCAFEVNGRQRFDAGSMGAPGIVAGGRASSDGRFFLIDHRGPTIVISSLDAAVAVVEIETADELVRQVPAAGTIAVPFSPSAEVLTIRADGESGRQLWTEQFELPDPPPQTSVDEDEEAYRRFEVAEGSTVDQILAAVDDADLDFSGAELEAALRAIDPDRWVPSTSPAAAGGEPLEGRLLASRLLFGRDDPPEVLAEYMARGFELTAARHGLDDAPALVGLTPAEVLVVASIIQVEAPEYADRPLVARVIYNRLEAGEPLGIDAVLAYDLGREVLTAADLDLDSPYNMRRVVGLPPTPIGAPDELSIEAALRPAEGDWFYFARTEPDGGLSFASTIEEFEEIVASCRDAGFCS
ncbi:MAG: endolytic transglycosylase MltG [Actinomycetota bacterium]